MYLKCLLEICHSGEKQDTARRDIKNKYFGFEQNPIKYFTPISPTSPQNFN